MNEALQTRSGEVQRGLPELQPGKLRAQNPVDLFFDGRQFLFIASRTNASPMISLRRFINPPPGGMGFAMINFHSAASADVSEPNINEP